MDLNSDPRWRRFTQTKTPCSCCGRVFDGVFDIGYDHPDAWPHGNLADSGKDVLIIGEDTLSGEYCRLGEYRFIRALITLPIKGSDAAFSFGPWGSVNPDNFERYLEAERTGAHFEGCFSWLSNILPGTGMTDALQCDLIPDEDTTLRPQLFVHDGPVLADWQENGITFDQLLDIYAAAGHDIRPHLMDA